ncbi:hypothetical protein OIU77_005388 [Salix suchowensis]|uniref:F-box domain-containing protein n=1 Tax=Salix suchowensis TaxID=1278906 RepID=A0ABQ9AR91_9ROSI|nr:hypothetical protein OIU77_005388 [Salix suchowensis]
MILHYFLTVSVTRHTKDLIASLSHLPFNIIPSKQKRFDRRMELSSGSVEGGVPFNDLPEECWANVLSLTTPRDVCRLSAVSPIFKSAAESDVVWQSFLPHDLESILSTAPDGSLLMSSASSKKEVYFSLCDNPIIVDNGRKSFSLEKKSGKKCYVLSAMDLEITWGDTPMYWTWNSISDSRFAEVAELKDVCWFEIRGKISTCLLSPETLYTAYLVYKFPPRTYGFDNQPVDVTMRLDEGEIGARTVSWNPQGRRRYINGSVTVRGSVHYPKERGDGWLETELGDFFSAEGEDGELEMRLFDDSGHWKSGFVLDGIEIRPKDVSRAAS